MASTAPAFRDTVFSKLFLLVSLAYIGASMQGFVNFEIWPSVEEYLGQLDPYLYFQKSWDEILLSPWGVRTGVAMPSLLLAEWTPLTQPQTFGLQCGLCMAITAWLINRTAVTCFRSSLVQHELAVTTVIFLLGYFMNGRLCSAFLGSALLMRAHMYWLYRKMPTYRVMVHNFLALPLLTVSSGTFVVGFATIILWLWFGLFTSPGYARGLAARLAMLPGMLPILYLASVQLFTFADKLHDYYHGEMVQMLYHGYGQFMEHYLPGLTGSHVVIMGLTSLPLGVIALRLYLTGKSHDQIYMTLAIALTVGLGVCGYSTMFTNTPTILLWLVSVVLQRRSVAAWGRRVVPC